MITALYVETNELDVFRQRSDDLELFYVESREDRVGDLIGCPSVSVGGLDVQVDEDLAGHVLPFVGAASDSPKPASRVKSETKIAALYVDKDGVYYGLNDVDPWDEERDARLYDGPYPVVAHPPCNRWSVIAALVEHVHGYKRGDDGGTFAAALDAVRAYGGVLEHPAHSLAWPRFGLPVPTVDRGWTLDLFGGASCFVDQARFGLPMSKPTWLYAQGCELPDLWTGESHATVPMNGGRRDQWKTATRDGHRVTHLGKRSLTPLAFRDVLLEMARSVNSPVPAGSSL